MLTPKAWVVLAALALVCTSLGYSIWFIVIRESPINLAALTIFAQPVCGLIAAAAWLGEKLHWGQLWGSMAIIGGLAIGLSRQIRTTDQPI
jgi:drug/metabolite transporter (DMT)-like permease